MPDTDPASTATATPADGVELLKALATLDRFEGLRDSVRMAVGVPSDTALSEVVAGWHVETTDVDLALYVLTAGGFSRYQRTRDGQTLTITLPIERVSRLALGGRGDELALTVEVDADQVAHQQEIESLEVDTTDNDGNPVTRSRARTAGTLRRSGYVLHAADASSAARLRRFYSQLSAVLHAHGR